MGLWMAAIAIGQWMVGEVAARWADWSHAALFAGLAAVSLAAVVGLALASRKIAHSVAGGASVSVE